METTNEKPPSLEEQIAAVKREIAMRRAVYPRQIARDRMTQEKADFEIRVMQAVLTTLENIKTELRNQEHHANLQ